MKRYIEVENHLIVKEIFNFAVEGCLKSFYLFKFKTRKFFLITISGFVSEC